MTNPTTLTGECTSGWSSTGPSYNWFDKKTVWGELEYRTADNSQSRSYYEYLTQNGSKRVITGSATYVPPNVEGPRRNAHAENKHYSECYIQHDDYIDDNSSDSTPSWIWALMSLLAIINLALFICTCFQKIKKRNEESQRPKHEKVGAKMQQGQPPSTSLGTKPDGCFDVGSAPDEGDVDNEGRLPSAAEGTKSEDGLNVGKAPDQGEADN